MKYLSLNDEPHLIISNEALNRYSNEFSLPQLFMSLRSTSTEQFDQAIQQLRMLCARHKEPDDPSLPLPLHIFKNHASANDCNIAILRQMVSKDCFPPHTPIYIFEDHRQSESALMRIEQVPLKLRVILLTPKYGKYIKNRELCDVISVYPQSITIQSVHSGKMVTVGLEQASKDNGTQYYPLKLVS